MNTYITKRLHPEDHRRWCKCLKHLRQLLRLKLSPTHFRDVEKRIRIVEDIVRAYETVDGGGI